MTLALDGNSAHSSGWWFGSAGEFQYEVSFRSAHASQGHSISEGSCSLVLMGFWSIFRVVLVVEIPVSTQLVVANARKSGCE